MVSCPQSIQSKAQGERKLATEMTLRYALERGFLSSFGLDCVGIVLCCIAPDLYWLGLYEALDGTGMARTWLLKDWQSEGVSGTIRE